MKGVMYKWIEKDMGELNRALVPNPFCCVSYYVAFILCKTTGQALHAVTGVRGAQNLMRSLTVACLKAAEG